MKKFCSKEGEIAYVVQGEGSRHFLLAHNAGGSHEMMGHTADYFARSAKVITPDLLGHGMSASPNIEYTLNLFAESLIQLCKAEKSKKVVFVGLNYGANVGIVMARIAPELISHLILIEPPIFMEPWIVKVVEEQIKKPPREEDAQEMVDSVLMKASAHEREISLKALKMTPPFVKASTFRNLLSWDKKHISHCSIPTLLIQTSHPFCLEEKARTLFSHLQVGRVVGSGPWATLEVPTQVHAMMDRFLESSK